MKVLSSLKNVSENPFYQMKGTLAMFQEFPKVTDETVTRSQVTSFLATAWNECKDNKEKRQLFMSIFFSIGDINREHNIFRGSGIKDIPNGGHAKRRTFALCLEWLAAVLPEQYYSLLPVIGEYYNLDGTMLYELRTDRYKGTLKEILHIPVDINRVTNYIASVLKNSKTSDNQAFLWAKWLPHIPSTKRTRKYVITDKNIKAFTKGGIEVKIGDIVKVNKDKKQHTVDKDGWVRNFIYALSTKMEWEVVKHPNNVEYKGYAAFKKKYLANTEAALFSSHRIKELDKTQFFEFLDQLPSAARFNVQRRLLIKEEKGKALKSRERWVSNHKFDLGQVYLEWLGSKEKAQEIVRTMTTEQKAALAPVELKQLEKAAKVNTGAETILDIVAKVLGSRMDMRNLDLIAQSLLDKVKIDVPVMVIADISGSMSSASVEHKDVRFTAQAMCQLLTTIFLLKNPDKELADMFIRYDNVAEVLCAGEKATAAGNNRFMGHSSTVIPWLTDKTKKFSENLANVSQYVITRGATQFNQIAISLKAWVDADPAFSNQRKEQINKYPVFLVCSDGDLNSHSTPSESLIDFQMKMRQWFGWEGVVVIWDVHSVDLKGNKFENIENVMYFGGCNVGILNQIFTKIDDVDIIDVYLPLKAISNSPRYIPVRALTL